MRILSLDLGTSRIKAGVVDFDEGSISYEEAPSPGIVAVDLREVMETAGALSRRVVGGSVDGVVVTGQRVGVTVTRGEEPLLPALTWMFTGVSESWAEVGRVLPQRVGVRNLMWIKDRHPREYRRATMVVNTDSYAYLVLSGRNVMSPSTAVYLGYWPGKGWHEVLGNVGTPNMPEVVEPGTMVGGLTERGARLLGLPEGTPVYMGLGDQQASTLALGALRQGFAKVSAGTGLFYHVGVTEPPYEFYSEALKAFILPAAGSWVMEGVLPGMGRFYDLVMGIMGVGYEEADGLALNEPPCAGGVRVIPLAAFGKGAVEGLSLSTTRASLARAVLEAAAFTARVFAELSALMGRAPRELAVDGGMALSRAFLRILAGATGMAARVPARPRATALVGAAALVEAGAGGAAEVSDRVLSPWARVEPGGEEYPCYEAFRDRLLEAAGEVA